MAVTADRPIEAPATLVEDQPRSLGFADQLGLWANLGISLLIPVTATFLVAPGQCVGWATYEVWIIAFAAHAVWDGLPRWGYVLLAGGVATLMALRPLGSVRLLKRIAVVAVVASSAYFLVETSRHPLGDLTEGGWTGFWTSADLVIALPVSWIPLVADYSRFSRSGRAAALGSGIGYALSSAAFFLLGVLALRAYGTGPGDDVVGALLAVPAGAIALVILAACEVDEAFANIYSTATSAQNIAPRADRRALALGVGAMATILALAVDGGSYEPFLFLIGAVFVPLAGTLVVDFALSRGGYDTSAHAPARWALLVPWVAGFAAYQLTNPTVLTAWPAWEGFWRDAQDLLGISPTNGFSASLVSLAVAALLTPLVRWRRTVRR